MKRLLWLLFRPTVLACVFVQLKQFLPVGSSTQGRQSHFCFDDIRHVQLKPRVTSRPHGLAPPLRLRPGTVGGAGPEGGRAGWPEPERFGSSERQEEPRKVNPKPTPYTSPGSTLPPDDLPYENCKLNVLRKAPIRCPHSPPQQKITQEEPPATERYTSKY